MGTTGGVIVVTVALNSSTHETVPSAPLTLDLRTVNVKEEAPHLWMKNVLVLLMDQSWITGGAAENSMVSF